MNYRSILRDPIELHGASLVPSFANCPPQRSIPRQRQRCITLLLTTFVMNRNVAGGPGPISKSIRFRLQLLLRYCSSKPGLKMSAHTCLDSKSIELVSCFGSVCRCLQLKIPLIDYLPQLVGRPFLSSRRNSVVE